jgi:uncharacterized iron-regulated membrane protein
VNAHSFRQTLRTIHLWVGIILCVPVVLIGLSGSALLLQREILRQSLPEASGAGPMQPIARIVEAAQGGAPGLNANWVELPASPGMAAAVQFVVSTRPARNMQVYVDPVSLEVLGKSDIGRGPIQIAIANMHEFLMLPPHIGLPFAGWMAVAMTFMGVSGLIVWWPRNGQWRRAFLMRRGARGLVLYLDLHRVAGIWGLVIFLVLSVSGIYLAFPQTISSAVRVAFPAGPVGSAREPGTTPPAVPTDPEEAIALAAAAVPDARVTGLRIPIVAGRPVVVQMESTGWGPSVPQITVTFDPRSAEVVSIDDPRTYAMADRVLNWEYALHFSLGTGRIWSFLVFLTGLLPLFLAVTGVTVWWRKRSARPLPRLEPAVVTER